MATAWSASSFGDAGLVYSPWAPFPAPSCLAGCLGPSASAQAPCALIGCAVPCVRSSSAVSSCPNMEVKQQQRADEKNVGRHHHCQQQPALTLPTSTMLVPPLLLTKAPLLLTQATLYYHL